MDAVGTVEAMSAAGVAITTMKAIIQTGYGSPDVLTMIDLAKPEPNDNQVLIRVVASSVNPVEWRRVRNDPAIIRPTEGWRRPKQPRLGGDVAGVVEAVGKDVTDFVPGQEVFGLANGAYAEYVATRAINLVAKPAGVSFEQAAAVPIAALTALQGLRDKAGLKPGARVLVTGAGGGVGSFAIQIAKALGASHVTAATSPANAELARSFGADAVIDYHDRAALRSQAPFDVIADVACTWSIPELLRALAPGGKIAAIGAAKGRFLAPVRRMAAAMLRPRLLGQPIVPFISKANRDDLRLFSEWLASGALRPHIDRTYPLSEIRDALRYAETGHVRGKVVITI
jgi:NADPH:quinone reductase-like Zn-dependent oxidoreductase